MFELDAALGRVERVPRWLPHFVDDRAQCVRSHEGGAAGAGSLGGARGTKGPERVVVADAQGWTTVRRGMRRYAYRRHERV